MQNNELNALLQHNGLDIVKSEQIIYNALRLQCFAKVCNALRTNDADRLHALQLLRSGVDPAVFSAKMVKKYCGCLLDEESCQFLGPLFFAFFRKAETRTKIPERVRAQLFAAQKGHCALCGNDIDTHADLDHIIPWIYVGDELPDNLQLLCRHCNRKKKASPLYPIQVLLTSRSARRCG